MERLTVNPPRPRSCPRPRIGTCSQPVRGPAFAMKLRRGKRGGLVLSAVLSTIFACSLQHAFCAEGPDEDKIPPLLPPRGLMPPGFWEQYGAWVIAGGCALLVLLIALIWFLTRPKPPVVLSPKAKALNVLEPLRQGPETGASLSRVSQAIRSYFAEVFALPRGELTTAEFCRALSQKPDAGAELYDRVAAFLTECDQRKFDDSAAAVPIGAVDRAIQLINNADERIAENRAKAMGQASTQTETAQKQPAVGGGASA